MTTTVTKAWKCRLNTSNGHIEVRMDSARPGVTVEARRVCAGLGDDGADDVVEANVSREEFIKWLFAVYKEVYA